MTGATTRMYGRVAFLSAISGFTLFIALHFLERDLDPAWHMVSEYALGRHGWAMTSTFLLLSLSCVALAYSILPFVKARRGKIGLALLVCAAAGLALASMFSTDPISVAPSEASRSAGIHALSVMIGVPSLTTAALLISSSVAEQPIWSAKTLPVLGFAHLIWISLALTVTVVAIRMPDNGGFGPEVPVGWPNRLMFIAYFGWLGSISWPLVRYNQEFLSEQA